MSCSTGPEFERSNPYDRDPEADPFGIEEFPPPNSIHTFTNEGIRISMPGSFNWGPVEVFRKRGLNEFENIGPFQYSSINRFYFDNEISSEEEIGYPLIYRFIHENGTLVERIIDFGTLESLVFSEENDEMVIRWKDRVYMNHGVYIVQERNGTYTELANISVPDSSFSFPSTTENLSSTFLVSPYRNFKGEKTFLDTTYFFTSPTAPSSLEYEILSPDKIKLTWSDNSSIETGFIVVDEISNDTIQVAADMEELIITGTINNFEEKSYTLYAVLGTIESDKITIQFQIPDFPYPEITGIEHIDQYKFEIFFEDRVSFERTISFSTFEKTFTVSNTHGSVIITIPVNEIIGDIDLSAELSYGRYGSRNIHVFYRPSLDIKTVYDINARLSAKIMDMRSIGDKLIYSIDNILYLLEINNINSTPTELLTLSDDIELVRLSNDNSLAFIATSSTYYLINVSSSSIISELTSLPESIHDASFIDDDKRIVFSSGDGFQLYDIDSDGLSKLSGFENNNELEFIGDATQSRLLALDPVSEKLYLFNTFDPFSYHITVDLSGWLGQVKAISHFNNSNNTMTFKNGGAYEFRIDQTECSPDNACWMYSIDQYERESIELVQVIDDEYRIVSSSNYLRIIGNQNGSDIQIDQKESSTDPLFLKINRDQNIAVEFDANSNKLTVFDITLKWKLTNFGVYDDIVWPEN